MNVENVYEIIATSKLIHQKRKIDSDIITTESIRISRCVDHHYEYDKATNKKITYYEYVKEFIMKNYNEMVFGSKFDDVYKPMIITKYRNKSGLAMHNLIDNDIIVK
jgi:hypothetical protein